MSIALTSGTTVTINGTTVETDATAEVTGLSVDFIAGTLTVTLKTGTLSGSTFTPGQYGPLVTLVVNLATGAWYTLTSGNGVVNESGTIPTASLSTIISELASMRNSAETFAAASSNGILPGTTTAYSSTSV